MHDSSNGCHRPGSSSLVIFPQNLHKEPMGESIAGAFLAFRGTGGPRVARAALNTALEQVLATALEAWPGRSVSPAGFGGYLAERVDPEAPDVIAALTALATTDLYLACA